MLTSSVTPCQLCQNKQTAHYDFTRVITKMLNTSLSLFRCASGGVGGTSSAEEAAQTKGESVDDGGEGREIKAERNIGGDDALAEESKERDGGRDKKGRRLPGGSPTVKEAGMERLMITSSLPNKVASLQTLFATGGYVLSPSSSCGLPTGLPTLTSDPGH